MGNRYTRRTSFATKDQTIQYVNIILGGTILYLTNLFENAEINYKKELIIS